MRYFIAFATFMLPNLIFSKPTDNHYDIKITIKGIQSEKALLGYYYGDKTYVVDSAKVDTETGKMRFFGNRRLLEGLYFVANTEGVILDFIVSEWKDFSISTYYNALLDSASVFRSQENKYYFDYLKTVKRKQTEIKKLQADLSVLQAKNDYPTFELYQRKIIEKYRFIDNLTNTSVKRYPDLFFTKLLSANNTPSVSDDIKPFDDFGKPNPAYYHYGCRHFWDDFDFNDTRLLRSKAYAQKLNQYMAQILPSNFDSLRRYCDFLLSKSKVTLEFYQYTLNHLTLYAEQRLDKINADQLYVYLIENYHSRTGSGTKKTALTSMTHKANHLKRFMIGQEAPTIELPDKNGFIQCLVETKAEWTIIYFNDNGRENAETIHSFHLFLNDNKALDLKVYVINQEPSQWENSEFANVVMVFEKEIDLNNHAYIYKECCPFLILDKNLKVVYKIKTANEIKEILSLHLR